MTPLVRLPHWRERLDALLVEAQADGFAWGRRDCALFGADVVLALTGEDFGAPFRGRYDDAAGAARALRKFGQGTITRTFDAHLKRVPRAFAQRGDLCALADRMRRTAAIGVVLGGEGAFVSDLGLERRGRHDWTRCWRVGR